MRKSALVLGSIALIASLSVAAPRPAQARDGFFPVFAGGLIAGALFGGIASPAYGYSPYGYYEPYAYRPYVPGPFVAGYSPFYDGYGYRSRYYRSYGYYRPYYRPYGYAYAAPYAGPRYSYRYVARPRYAIRSYRAPRDHYYHRAPNYTYASYVRPHRNWRAAHNFYRGPHRAHRIHHARHRH